MKKFFVWAYGDSLMLPRPGYVNYNQRYLTLLQDYWQSQYSDFLIEIFDRSRPNCTIPDLFDFYKQDSAYFDFDPNIVIINCGICDCAPRPVPNKLRDKISRTPEWIKISLIDFLHNNRSVILESGFIWRNVPPEDFETILNDWLNMLSSKNIRVYIINIVPTNKKTEERSPGLSASINKYNKIFYDTISNFNNDCRIHLIDINQLIKDSELSIEEYVLEDGHHTTPLVHKLISDQIIQIESKYVKIGVDSNNED